MLTREVPWDNLADDAHGFMASVRELVLATLEYAVKKTSFTYARQCTYRDFFSLDLICPASIVPDAANRRSDIVDLRPIKCFALKPDRIGRESLLAPTLTLKKWKLTIVQSF